MVEVLVLIHQTLVIGAVDKSRTGSCGCFIQLQGEVQLKHRKIMGIQHHVLISAANPLGAAPSLIGGVIAHQSGFKPGTCGGLLSFLVPDIHAPGITGGRLQGFTAVFDIQ